MTDETYQGWKNRETWAAALWINNMEGLYHEAGRVVREAPPYSVDRADALQTLIEEILDNPPNEVHAQMSKEIGSRWRVDWSDIVDTLLED